MARGPPNRERKGGEEGGGGGSPQLKTDTPIQDSHYGLQKTIGFCNFCFTSAIGVSLFAKHFHYVSYEMLTFAKSCSGAMRTRNTGFRGCTVRNA